MQPPPPGASAPAYQPPVFDRHGQCQVCGAWGARFEEFRQVTGIIVFFKIATRSGWFCRDCGLSLGRAAQTHTVGVGWFGFLAPLVTVYAIVTNSMALRRLSSLQTTRTHLSLDPGRPALFRWGSWLLAAFVAVVVILAFLTPEVRPIEDLRVGDCLNDTWGDQEEVFDTKIIDCNEPHDFETFATVNLGPRAARFPGDDEVAEQTYEACVEVIEAYIGRDFLSSPFDVYTFSPTRGGWALGDREGTCMLYRIDGAQLLQSVKPSA